MASKEKQDTPRRRLDGEQQELLHHIGARLRSLRERRGVSRAKAAAAIGLSVQAYSNREAGATEIKAFEVVILADLLGIDPAVLIDGAGDIWPGAGYPMQVPNGEPGRAAEVEEFLYHLERIRDPILRRDVADAIKALARAVNDPG